MIFFPKKCKSIEIDCLVINKYQMTNRFCLLNIILRDKQSIVKKIAVNPSENIYH